ncbi:response regulator [Chamaesiphon sp.]|uniref:response regulator n=1 Tax=Chamaesiphon sp. TaxID=2814140 RepID=UPI0035945039
MNCDDGDDLVKAERAKALELYAAQIDKLDRDIVAAQATRSLVAEATANEAAAQFYLEWGKEKIAAVYLQDAYDLYTKSGATTKIASLDRRHPQLLQHRSQTEWDNYFTDEFIATLSHEFRNPLNGILGMSEALLEEVFGVMNERQLNAITTIDRSGGYLLALINNMTDLSKIQVGKLELEITNVSVLELCQYSSTFVKHHAIGKQIQLDLDVSAHVGQILVDLHRMRQVLINLLNHAIDSTPVGGRVKLVATREAQTNAEATASIQFAIIDTSKQTSTTQDDKFSQSTFPTDNHRVGLGLMLVSPIVELHGGVLSCQTIIGQGSYTQVSLPETCLVPADAIDGGCSDYLASISTTIVEEVLTPPLILIVEDNELNINTISSYLTVKGYRPIVAGDGQSAIELTQKHHPDLILMDIQMPGMDGLEAISRIRQDPQLAEIPIIALTALAMEGDRDKCLSAGANDYLTKPVKLKQLNQTIQQWLN